ncbi:HK97 family phage prohead protease [Sphingomonas arenae]|uniref:HK97 family phage prohead protease n=1 Tax=Sphingomonas arenae TaxID=2812555 RepID=UPI001967A487|nr:HK97 family phage prohead protease [Sphingomonas arenae]
MARERTVRFAGYAAVFDRVDNGGDVVRRGAFARSLARSGPVPLLWQHKTGAVIGSIEKIVEDGRGLRVIGRVGGGERGKWIASMVRGRAVDGLSFGYRVRRSARRDGVRELMDLDLIEVSVVANPMQPLARVHAVEG